MFIRVLEIAEERHVCIIRDEKNFEKFVLLDEKLAISFLEDLLRFNSDFNFKLIC